MDYKAMTIPQLEALKKDLGLEIEKLDNQRLTIARAIDYKLAEAKIAAMPDAERAALAQVIKAQSAVGESAVGTPGAK